MLNETFSVIQTPCIGSIAVCTVYQCFIVTKAGKNEVSSRNNCYRLLNFARTRPRNMNDVSHAISSGSSIWRALGTAADSRNF